MSDKDYLENYIEEIKRSIETLKICGFNIKKIIIADGLFLSILDSTGKYGEITLKEGMQGILLGIPCIVQPIFDIYLICVKD